MRLLIRHETRLAFAKPVREHQCELRLLPRADAAQNVAAARIETEPATALGQYEDCFGNRVTTLSILPPHDGLVVTLAAEVETRLGNPFDYEPVPPAAEDAWLAEARRRDPRLLDFVLHRSPQVPALREEAGLPSPPPRPSGASVLEAVQGAVGWIGEHFRYETGSTEVHETLDTLLEKRAGVCQDFAHLLVALVRGWGVPARYAMGYLDPGSSDGLSHPDASLATHAWAEVLIPGAGWRGFDPTQGLLVDDRYVTVAVGRDSRDAAPLRGSFRGEPASEPPSVRLEIARQGQ